MTEPTPQKDERIEILFRNGTITVVGIVLAFSLGFLTHWGPVAKFCCCNLLSELFGDLRWL